MAQVEPTLAVWAFRGPRDARRALERLRSHSPAVDDAAIIAWPSERPEPETCEFYRVAAGADRMRIWPELFGAVFDHPEKLSPLFTGLGVDDRLVRRLRRRLRPGTSILLVVTTRRIDDDFPDLEATRLLTRRRRSRQTPPREAFASHR